MWVTFLRSFNGRSMLRFVEAGAGDIEMGSDASKSGYGGYLGSTPVAGVFSPEWSELDIETLEMYPILAMVGAFAHRLKNLTVRVLCDNQPLVYCLNALTSRNPRVLHLLRILVPLLLDYNIALKAEYLTSEANVVCDTLSRRQVSSGWLGRHGLERSLAGIHPRYRTSALRSLLTVQ